MTPEPVVILNRTSPRRPSAPAKADMTILASAIRRRRRSRWNAPCKQAQEHIDWWTDLPRSGRARRPNLVAPGRTGDVRAQINAARLPAGIGRRLHPGLL